ncbi:hypothetical protein [Helicobacter canis]|uniref:hypothetical protein n=1 Tax=Helicobacter canis TaxID=29419 RepID=UPI000E0EBBA9|nr:hypothetical protein [Helicobacter canis]
MSLREIRKDFVAIHTKIYQPPRIHFFNFSPYIFNISLESTFEKVDSRDNAHFLSLQAVLAPRAKCGF